MSSARHPSWTQTYRARAHHPDNSPLASYFLRLVAFKKSNLCLSADVSTSAELLAIAEETGDSICLLKTHADIVSDWSERTAKKLQDVARRKNFLIFEDRKFADIGGTVQKQYTGGPIKIAQWAEITNAHILPGPAIVKALKEAAASVIASYNTAVLTEISASPQVSAGSDTDSPSVPEASLESSTLEPTGPPQRKQSVVSVSTTISRREEDLSPQPTNDMSDNESGINNMLQRLGPAPYLRGLLLLGEMSSEGNLLTGDYTRKTAEIARQHKDFVIGFIAQHSLNEQEGDNFITMTPGVKLPPPGEEQKKMGDALGQQYNSPRQIVCQQGADIVIVGRGIIAAKDRREEAERYRKESWAAYEERINGANA